MSIADDELMTIECEHYSVVVLIRNGCRRWKGGGASSERGGFPEERLLGVRGQCGSERGGEKGVSGENVEGTAGGSPRMSVCWESFMRAVNEVTDKI